MPRVTVLLVSTDSPLVDTCREVIGSIGNLHPVVLSRSEEVEAYLRHEQLALVLLHVASKDDAEQASRLLRRIGSLQRPVATVVLGEQHEPHLALALPRQGVADYLSRPLDLTRLAYLIDSLTVRARYAPSWLASRVDGSPTRARRAGEQAAVISVTSTPTRRASEVGATVPEAVIKVGNDCLADCPFFSLDTLMEQVSLIASQDLVVLLSGETGTGKTRRAARRFIHDLSPRAKSRSW